MKLTKKELRELGNRKISRKELSEMDPTTKCLVFGKKSKGMSIFYIYSIPDMLYLDYQPKYVVFQETNDFISLVNAAAGNFGWSTKKTDDLLVDVDGYSIRKPELIKMLSTSKCQFENAMDFVKTIVSQQLDIRYKKLNEKHEKIKERIDAQMNKVPAVPKDFINWVEKRGKTRKLFMDDNVIYYKKQGSHYKGHCTACEQEVSIQTPVHNNKGYCPECNNPIRYKSEGLTKSRRVGDSWYLIQKLKKSNNLVCRFFIGTRKYESDYRNPRTSFEEVTRVIIEESGKSTTYSYDTFLSTGEIRWREGIVKPGMGMYHTSRCELVCAPIYPGNLPKVFKNTIWEYAPFKEYPLNGKKPFPTGYLETFAKYPQIEYLAKIGSTNLVEELFSTSYSTTEQICNTEAKNAQDFLGVQRKDLAQVIKNNMNFVHLEIYKELKEQGSFVDKNGKIILPEVSDELLSRVFEVFLPATTNYYYRGVCSNLRTVFQHTTVVKMLNYINKQILQYRKVWEGRLGTTKSDRRMKADVLSEWIDYMRVAKEVEAQFKKRNKQIEPFEIFPKNLKERHDEVVTLKDEENLNEKSAIIKKLNANWEHYQYTDQELGFTIRPPKDAFELVNESNKLHHCVKTYIDKVCGETTTILFVRDCSEPETPLYTLEYRDNHIIQFRGKNNKAVPDNAREFINKWEDRIKQQNSEKNNKAVPDNISEFASKREEHVKKQKCS